MDEKFGVGYKIHCRADALVAEANRMMMCGEDRYETWCLDHPRKAEAIWLRFLDNKTIGYSDTLIAYLDKLLALTADMVQTEMAK